MIDQKEREAMKKYIDADVLKEHISIDGMPALEAALKQWIDNQPAADVAPVKPAHWLEKVDDMYAGGGAWLCSSCGYAFSWKVFNLLDEQNYCPHCGANMNEKSTN